MSTIVKCQLSAYLWGVLFKKWIKNILYSNCKMSTTVKCQLCKVNNCKMSKIIKCQLSAYVLGVLFKKWIDNIKNKINYSNQVIIPGLFINNDKISQFFLFDLLNFSFVNTNKFKRLDWSTIIDVTAFISEHYHNLCHLSKLQNL